MVMEMDVCIKNVGDDAWRMFKSESAKNGMRTGEFFTKIVEDYNAKKTGNFRKILYREKPLKNILKDVDYRKIREEFNKDFEKEFSK